MFVHTVRMESLPVEILAKLLRYLNMMSERTYTPQKMVRLERISGNHHVRDNIPYVHRFHCTYTYIGSTVHICT